eukprot:8377802-Pyramimonas_sp.AAC.1
MMVVAPEAAGKRTLGHEVCGKPCEHATKTEHTVRCLDTLHGTLNLPHLAHRTFPVVSAVRGPPEGLLPRELTCTLSEIGAIRYLEISTVMFRALRSP